MPPAILRALLASLCFHLPLFHASVLFTCGNILSVGKSPYQPHITSVIDLHIIPHIWGIINGHWSIIPGIIEALTTGSLSLLVISAETMLDKPIILKETDQWSP